MKEYSEFYNDVRESVKKRLACHGMNDEELDEYLKSEEAQIKSEYRHYSEGNLPDGMTPEAYYNSCVNGVAMCLEYCY